MAFWQSNRMTGSPCIFGGVAELPFVDFATRTVALSTEELEPRKAVCALPPEREFAREDSQRPSAWLRPSLILTNRCNLAYTYCFADSGTYEHTRKAEMDPALATGVVSLA